MTLRTDKGEFEIYTELMISLPSEWKLTKEDWNDENNYWSIRWLYILTHFPHASDTCLLANNSIPNADPAEPLANNTGFIGFIIELPKLVSEDFIYLEGNNKNIVFLALYQVYHGEMMYKLEEGTNKFFELADSANFTELVDIRRKSITLQRAFLEKIVNFIRY